MSCLKISSLKVSFKRGLEHSACLCCCVSNYRAQKNVFFFIYSFFFGEENNSSSLHKTWTKLKDFKRRIDSCACCLIVFVADNWPIRAAFRGEERPARPGPTLSLLFVSSLFHPQFSAASSALRPTTVPPPVRLFIPPLGPAVCSESPDFSAPNREWLTLISVSPPSPNSQLLLLLLLLWACFFFPSQQLCCWEPSRW